MIIKVILCMCPKVAVFREKLFDKNLLNLIFMFSSQISPSEHFMNSRLITCQLKYFIDFTILIWIIMPNKANRHRNICKYFGIMKKSPRSSLII